MQPDDGLFDMQPVAIPAASMSTEQKRRARQLARIRVGWHPLTDSLRLHENASRDVEPYQGGREPYRCGTCLHRQRVGGHAKSYPKCDVGGWVRATNGPGTDVLAWWPACVDYEPK